jgi:hypothetical protein
MKETIITIVDEDTWEQRVKDTDFPHSMRAAGTLLAAQLREERECSERGAASAKGLLDAYEAQLRETKAALIAEQEHTEQLEAVLAERERELAELDEVLRKVRTCASIPDYVMDLVKAVQQKRRNGATGNEAPLSDQKRKGA